jgi:outer membrane protein assembly factor BamB
VLIVPVKTGYNLQGGNTRGVNLADGKTLWEVPGHPGRLAYATIEGRKCLVNAGICIEAKTGKVLWQQQAEQTYNGPPVVAGNVLIGYVPHPKSDPPRTMGIVAGFQLDLTGAKKIWTLDERFHRSIVSDGGGFRYFAVRDGVVYNAIASSDNPGKKSSPGSGVIQIIRPTDGAILASQPAEGLSLPFLWGDRLVLAGDVNHRPRGANPEYWQFYTTDPDNFKALGQRWLATDKHQGTGGYELQVYDPFADGLVFMRVFGGIRCYDLRGNRTK